MTDLTTATTPRRMAADRFEVDVPDTWQQGRGAFGGLVVGNLTRAILMSDDPSPDRPRALRSLTAVICGPVLVGPNDLHVERLRTGTGVATLAARISRDGEVLAHAVGILGRDRAPGTDFDDIPRPVIPPWRELPKPGRLPFGPPFSVHFEFWPMPPLPFSSDKDAVTRGWVRARDPGTARDAATIATIVDAYWPAIFSRFAEPRPMATIAFTLELFDGTDGLDPEAPFFYSAKAHAGRGGYVAEERLLFGEDGRLIARNHQTFTIIQ